MFRSLNNEVDLEGNGVATTTPLPSEATFALCITPGELIHDESSLLNFDLVRSLDNNEVELEGNVMATTIPLPSETTSALRAPFSGELIHDYYSSQKTDESPKCRSLSFSNLDPYSIPETPDFPWMMEDTDVTDSMH